MSIFNNVLFFVLRRRAVWFFSLLGLSLAAVLPSQCYAVIESYEPVATFTTRVIRSFNVLVGAPSGVEGTAWRSGFLDIKEATSDRVVLEYDLRGQTLTESAVLNLELTNLDVPNFTTVFLYTFEGNGLAEATDYFKTDNLVTSFTDNGLASNFVPPYHIPFSLDLTSTYNQAITNGDSFLGIVLRNTTAESQYARYRITSFNGFPKLVVGVPEPSSMSLVFACVFCSLIGQKRIRR